MEKSSFERARFVKEGESFEKDLQGILKECSNAKTIMFTVDDAFFYRNFSLSECANLLERRKDVYSASEALFAYRLLSSGTEKCESTDATQGFNIHDIRSIGRYDGLELSLGSCGKCVSYVVSSQSHHSISRVSQEYHSNTNRYIRDVLKMFRVLNSMYGASACNHPNRLEAAGDKISNKSRHSSCSVLIRNLDVHVCVKP